MDERNQKSADPTADGPTIDIGISAEAPQDPSPDLEVGGTIHMATPTPEQARPKKPESSLGLDPGPYGPPGSGTQTHPTSTQTKVDLGEDLLESTVTRASSSERVGSPIASSDHRRGSDSARLGSLLHSELNEALENAKILGQEGFFEDAKKILRRILLRDPRHVSAKKRLEEIQDQELKTILNSREAPRVPVRWRREKDTILADPEEILRQLDQDLGLGLMLNSPGKRAKGSISAILFEKRADLLDFQSLVLKSTESKALTAKMDLGIAFLEMDLAEIALALFKSAIEQSARENDRADLGAQVLAAEAHLRMGEAFEVIFVLDPVITSADLPREKKVEPYYLLARAQQLLGRDEEALHLYRVTVGLVPHYRDADERIRALLERKLQKQ